MPVMKLTKNDLIENLTLKHNFSKKESSKIIETIIEIMKSTLESGEDILISSIGKFCVNTKKERRGRNPSTGTAMMLDARRVVTFKCSRVLKEKINE